jgi:hypothetical protein
MRIQKSEEGYGNMGMITHVCICGSALFNVQCTFDDYEISSYNLDMTCAICSTEWIAPTEVDRP